MSWDNMPPKEPGFYWFIWRATAAPEPVELDANGVIHFIHDDGDLEDERTATLQELRGDSYWWPEPLSPPGR